MKKTPVIWRVLLGVVLCALIVFAYARPCFSRGECAALIALGCVLLRKRRNGRHA